MVDVASLLLARQNVPTDVHHGSFGGHIANVSCTSHSCFESRSGGVMNWDHTVRESFLPRKEQ